MAPPAGMRSGGPSRALRPGAPRYPSFTPDRDLIAVERAAILGGAGLLERLRRAQGRTEAPPLVPTATGRRTVRSSP